MAWSDVGQVLQKGWLTSRDSVLRRAPLRAISSIQIDSNIYFFKSIRNQEDSVAVLSRAIEGKVSVYSPPFESGRDAIFVEKEEATYEMLQKTVEKDGRKFHKDEFKGFLQVLFSDCESITKDMIDHTFLSELAIMRIVSRYNK